MCRLVGLVTVLLLSLTAQVFAQPPYDPDEGTLSSARPRIPEPMVFDLVRPLGAERGELEVNSLFRLNPASPRIFEWAPEVEYAFAGGYGIEFELPIEGTTRESVKLAFQGTLPGPAPKRFIHGYQGIWERNRHGETDVDLLYLAGLRWSQSWSGFSMNGLRRGTGHDGGTSWVGNYSLFYHASRETTYGVESNLMAGADSRMLIMPQVHTRASRFNIQAGAGLVRVAGRGQLQLAWRVSREF